MQLTVQHKTRRVAWERT